MIVLSQKRENNMDHLSSILDYQKQTLSPEIWENLKIKSSIKKFIYKSIEGFFVSLNLKGYSDFVSNLFIGSSLATFFYREDSDLDVKIVIDVDLFKKHNPDYENSTSEDICDELIESARKSPFLTAFIPNTYHPLDAYFFSIEEAEQSTLIKYDSLYNLIKDTWIKLPRKLTGELSSAYIINYTKSIAQKYINKLVLDVETTKRDSVDFLILKDYMKTLDKASLKELGTLFHSLLEKINADIEKILTDKKMVKRLRKKEFSKKKLKSDLEKLMGSINYSDGNLIYKLLQRYGYLRIILEIGSLFNHKRVGPGDVIDIYKIISGEK